MAKIISREPPLLPPIAFNGAVARLAPVIDSVADCGATHRRRVFLLPRALAAPITSLGLMEIAAQLQVD